LYKLQCDPSDGDVSLLRDVKHDGKPVRRLRVGSYRVGFQLVGNVLVVISVLWIDKRGDSY
jgi:mRNA-degrading endonuclease RelE of RelBE toxin-antitoxin system